MLFAAQETPLFVLNDDEALFANERGTTAEDASTLNINAHCNNNEEEEEDRTRIEKKQQNDFSSGSGDIVRLRDGSLLSWRTRSGKNAVEIVEWREERGGKRRENAASRAVKTIEITFPTDTENELCAKSVVLAPTSVNDDGASLFRVIACNRTVQNNGKVLEMYVATVEESADKSSLRLKGGAVAKKAVKLETAGVGDSVTCAGLVSGADERSPIVCVGGTDGRKVVFVDVLSGEALSEIAVGSQSISSSSAAAIGSSLLGKFGISLGAKGTMPPVVHVSPRLIELDGSMVTVIVTGDGAVTCVTSSTANTKGAFGSNSQANRRVLFRMMLPKGALKSDALITSSCRENDTTNSAPQYWFVTGARATAGGNLVVFGNEDLGREHVTAYTFVSTNEIRRMATFTITDSADSVRDVYFDSESGEIFVFFSSNCVSKWSVADSLRVVETLESDLAKFESWAINGVGSEAALSALRISFFGDLNDIGVDKSEMHTFAKILASEISEIGLDRGVSAAGFRRALGKDFESDGTSIVDAIAATLASSSETVDDLVQNWGEFVKRYVAEWKLGNLGVAFSVVKSFTDAEKEELLFLRKSGISALATSGKNASSSGAHMRFQNDAVENATSLLSRAAGNSVERMAKLLGCNFCGLENREAVDWLDLATCEATGTGGLSMTGRSSSSSAHDALFRDQRRLLQRQTILTVRKAWESLIVNDKDLAACAQSIEVALSQSVHDIASSSSSSFTSAKKLRMLAHKAFGFAMLLRLASKGSACLTPKKVSNDAFTLLPRVLLVFALSSALSSVCALDPDTIAIQAFAKQRGDPAMVVVDLFRRGEIEASEKIALAFLGSAIPGDYEKKSEEDESLLCYEGERPALAFARALAMLARRAAQTSHSDEEASRLFFQAALRLEKVDDSENKILAETARTIRTSILGDDDDDAKNAQDRGRGAQDPRTYDALEHHETVALAFERIFSSRLSHASLKFTMAAISEAELVTEFESQEDAARLIDAKERLWHASLRRACDENDFVSAFVSTLFLYNSLAAARHSNFSGVRALVESACDAMGVNCGATADIGRVIKSLPFGEAIYAARETLERKSRTHKLNHQSQDDKDQGTATIVSPSEILYSMLVDRWELKDAALVAAQDAVRFGDEARRKVCEAAKDPQNAQLRDDAIESVQRHLHGLEKSLAALTATRGDERCGTDGEVFFAPTHDDFGEEEGTDDEMHVEKGSSESSQEEIVFEKLRIHNNDNDEGNDVARQNQQPPNDRVPPPKPKRHKMLHPPTGDDEIGVGSPLAAMARMVALTKARLLLLKNDAYLEELAIEKQKFTNIASLFDESAVKAVCESLLKRGFFDDCSDLVSLWFSNHELRDVASQISCCAGAFAAETIQHSSESHHSAKLPIGFKCVKVSSSLSNSSNTLANENPWVASRKIVDKFENVETNGMIAHSACLGALSVNPDLELPLFLTENVHCDKLISLYLKANRPACAARVALKELELYSHASAMKRVKHNAVWLPMDAFHAVQIALDDDAFSNKKKHIAAALRIVIDSHRNQLEKDAKTLAQVHQMY